MRTMTEKQKTDESRKARLGAVIAAAGAPGGFRAYDRLAHTEGTDMVRRMIGTFRRAGVEEIAVITGYRAEETEKSLAKQGVVFLRCENYETAQMLDFAVMGIRYLAKTCGRFYFCPSDVPLFEEHTLRMMAGEDAPVVIPVYRGRKGHPVLINASLAGQIASYRGDRGLKGAIDAAGVPVSFVAVEDGGVLLRAREEDRFEEVAGREKPVPVHPRVKVQLVRNVPFFGPGLMNLLRQIEVLGNVREACEKTGMSYSKGWTLIRTAEKELGYVIVERSPGGKHGGSARVSSRGSTLMEQYETMGRRIASFAEEEYRKIFEGE